MQLNDYSEIKIDEKGNYFSGVSYFPTISQIIGNSTVLYTTVQSNEAYRSDKIADRLWGNQDLHWILDVINHFTGVKEYSSATPIKYVSLDRLIKIGMI